MTDPVLVVVADDLTGAIDTAHEFAARGYRTVVAESDDRERPEAVDVRVVNTDSRTMGRADAAEAVVEAVTRCEARTVYKKVDSTMRGNVSAEVDAAVAATDADLAVVAPAAPRQHRVVAGGHLLVEGSPVGAVADYDERETPPESSNLTAALADSASPVEHVSVSTVARGAAAVRDRLDAVAETDESALVVCDATLDAHLEAVADACVRTTANVVYAGSSGLAKHVAVGPHAADRRVLGVVGSTNERTVEQLSAVPDDRVVALDVERALDAPADAGQDAAEQFCERVVEGGTAVVTSVQSRDDVEATYRRGRERYELDRSAVRNRVGDALAAAVARIWDRSPPDGLFVTGGTVATRVFRELGVERVEPTGRAVEDGIPIVRLDGGRIASLPTVTKAGGFGERDALRRSLRALERGEFEA